MCKKITFLLCFLFAFSWARAGYNNVVVTGFNDDVVANGIGAATASTTADVDGTGTGYVFVTPDFQQTSSATLPTQFLPANGQIASISTPGMTYQLASYSSNNALRLPSTHATDSLVFGTAQAAGEVYLLVCSGNGASTCDVTVNFTDGTTQLFAAQSVTDWYNGTPYAINSIGRALRSSGALDATATNGPRLYDLKLTISSSNYSKTIRSIKVSRNTSSSGVPHVMAVGINTLCSGSAVGGTAALVGGGSSVCPGLDLSLTLSGNSTGVGTTFQWQSNSGSGWTNISGATTNPYTLTGGIAVATQFRAYVSCQGANADTSAIKSVTLNPANQCYCVPGTTSCNSSDVITNVTLGTLNNTTTCSTNGYGDYTTLPVVALTQGQSYPMSVTVGPGGTEYVSVWIDYNQNGVFDASEYFFLGSANGAVVNGTLAIPASAYPGNTRMRVRVRYNQQLATTEACVAYTYGEAEDYMVNILPLPACATPTAQATGLVLTPGPSTVSGSFTAASPAVDKYLVIRTNGTAALTATPTSTYAYALGAIIGNGTVVSYGATTTFTDAGLNLNTQYSYYVFAANNTATCGPTYLTTAPLTAVTTTTGPNSYVWNATTGSADWTVAASWTPARTLPDATDILQFTNGGSSTATNIPTQTVRQIAFGNNTTTNFQAGTAAATLTLASDNDPTTNELNIGAGSSLVSNGATSALTLVFSGTGGLGKIAGNLEMVHTSSVANKVDFTGAIDTVTSTGTLAAGGAGTTSAYTSSATNLVVMGTFNHKYTTGNGGAVPTATYGIGSNVLISGYTTAGGGPGGGLGQTFYNFTMNCPNLANASQWSGTIPTNVTNNFNVISTNNNIWQFATTTAYTMNINNFIQTGGIIDLGTTSGAKIMNVSGTFNQTAGLIKYTGSSTATLNFNGTTAAQNVNFLDSAIVGTVVYQVTNPAGITLTGSGNFTTNNAFKINSGGGVRITSVAANPINTTLVLTYAATNTTLTYDAPGATTTTANVWPTTNGPLNVTQNMSGAAPANILNLGANRTIANTGILTLTNGVLVLGSNNLSMASGSTLTVSSPSATKMIAADGTGQLIRNMGTTAATYLYPIGDLTNGADYSPVSISIVTNAAPRNVGARVVDAQNPNDLSTTNYLTRYWVMTDDSVNTTNAYTYNGNFSYPNTDIVGTEANIRLNRWNGTAWAQVPSNVPSGSLVIVGNQSNANFALGNGQFTGRPAVTTTNIYTWIGNTTSSTDYQVPANWTPARNIPDITDVLQFNDGLIDTVKNIPTQTVGRLVFANNTTAAFLAPSTATLTLQSDNNAATNELDIAAGSSLVNNSTAAALTLAFSGTGGTGKIAGILHVNNGTPSNAVNFSNAIDTVTATGTLSAGGTGTAGAFTSTAANLVINGTYEHKYTTTTGGAIPTATWGVGSNALISGFTTTTGGPNGGLGQTFYNFTYNCPNQTANSQWSGTVPATVLGTLSVVSTGTTGTWSMGNTSNTVTIVTNNFSQSGGTVDLTGTGAKSISVGGTYNQTGGLLKSSGAGVVTLNFNGTTAAQNVTFLDSAIVGPVVYQVTNSAGITLIGTGNFTTNNAFKINSSGGVRISTGATAPITTTLVLTYAATGTTLTYDATPAVTSTATVWPATNGPLNVTVNDANGITVPFSRTIGGTLTMTAGDIDISTNTLTLGTAAATPGALTYTAGGIRVTSGSLIRWYGTTSLPTSAGTAVGFYPLSYGGVNRNVAISFSAATALSTGGTIGVGHTNVNGLFTLTPAVSDASASPTYNINKRTSSSWAFTTGNGIAASGTLNVKLTGTGLFNLSIPSSSANLRVMQAAAVAGTHAAGSGFSAFRTGLAIADLANPYYIGAADTNIADGYIAIATGNWSTPATWLNNNVPGITNDATINPGVQVTVDAATNAAKSLTILATGTLMVNNAANTVTIDSVLVNSGAVAALNGTVKVNGNSGASGITNNLGASFNVVGGTVTLGPTGGGNKPFTNNGQLIVANGTLNINGNYVANTGSSTNQSGGAINVDGNAGGNPTNSVAASTPIVNLLSPTLSFTGGTFTVVDPHPASTGTNTFVYNNATTVAALNTHTFRFGNGTSLDTATNTSYLFSVNPNIGSGKLVFNNVEINSGTGTNRAVVGGGTFGVMGNFVVNNGGEFRINSGITLYLNGNLTVNTGGIFTTNTLASAGNTVYFGNYSTGTVQPATAPQTVSGGGWFRNMNSATPTANFHSITVSNSNMVTFNMTNDSASYTGTVTFVAGATGPSRIKMPGVSRLIENGGSLPSAGQSNGWIWGRHQKQAPSSSAMNHTFSVGDSLYYTPVVVTTSSAPTAGGAMWAKSTPGDHPNIASSAINASKSINRYYTIQPVNGLTIAAGTATAQCTWVAADVDPGINTANIRGAVYASATWNYPPANTPTATSQTVTGLAPVLAGDYQFGEFCAPLNITTQPAATSACLGGPATFTVGLSAGTTGVNYQWQKGGTNISGATNATYTIPAVIATDAGNYTVILTSSCSAAAPVTSAIAALTINTPASITTQPTAQTACNGSPATFTVVAAGTGVTYQWLKNGTAITGATNATYTIAAVSSADVANYSVTVIGAAPCGNITSSAVGLTVSPLPLTIVAAGSTTFCAGGSVILKASSTAGLTYQWKLGGTNIGGATDSTYTATQFGNYTAQITNTANSCTNVSNTIAVVNGAPASSITPSGAVAICTGDSTVLSGPTPGGVTYQWKLGGSAIIGATNATYKAGAAGIYTLDVATGPACVGTSTPTTISLTPLPTVTVTPATATTFCAGGTVVINSTATGVNYQWQNNGTAITGATNATYSATATGSYTLMVTSTATTCKNTSTPAVAVTVNPLPTATIAAAGATSFCTGGTVKLRTTNASGLTYQWLRGGTAVAGATDSTYIASVSGAYTVTVTNTATTCSATTATATTVTVNPLPNVTVTASGGTTICQGTATNLCVPSATGLTYQWALNGPAITGATTACYNATIAGSYIVTVTNTATTCTATSTASVITVNPAPVATATALGNTTVCQGDTVWLNSNVVSGLTYQWNINGNPIPGATTTAYGATSTGLFTVTTNNGNCSTTSTGISVTVNAKPTSTIAYTTPITFCEGGAVVLTGISGGGIAGGVTYQWNNNAAPVPGATDNYLIANQTGNYSVLITNAAGCSATSAQVLVVVNPLPQPVITQSGSILSTVGSYASYQWYFNSQPINGATSQSYNVTQNGAYFVRVTDVNGCTNYSSVTFFNNVGVPNVSVAASDIKIYPNPAHQIVNIDAPVKVNVMIRDLQGRVILTQKDVKRVDLGDIASGVYMIMVLDEDGQLLKMEKLFKSE
ncbi:GEVED domain-containing protein [Taibaiella soli]|uniref:Ig-like domain-containing protein n=1 Tax=Taibaiella soli TaxID=1649169 RepID=A0A2W2BHW0_9BACT|nr:GEVED domain-containing protein [Taibaiella soli]PZF73096.1 hypothetical protein DN068_09485 [Taibaiella soli]